MITLLDIFQKMNKQKVKNKVIKFNLFQQEVNQTRENRTKIVQKIIKNLLKILQQVDFLYLQNSIYVIICY